MAGTSGDNIELSGDVSEKILKTAIQLQTGKADVMVTDVRVSPGSQSANNYGSVVNCITVTAKVCGSQSLHRLFVKTVHEDKVRKQRSLQKTLVFSREETMYSELIPIMKKIQIERFGSVFGPSVPDFYHSLVNSDTGIIILQDCRPEGYCVQNSQQGVDFEHCKLVMKEIAIFHALSWAMKSEDMGNINKYPFLFQHHFAGGSIHQLLQKSVASFADLTNKRSTTTRLKDAATKLSLMNLEQTMKDILQPREPYAVVCHGDFHINNLLFKHAQNDPNCQPIDVKLIDLQVVHYAPPTTDLALFIYSSTSRSTRKRYLKTLLLHYHEEFLKCLGKLNIDFPQFSFDVLQNLYVQSALLGMIMSCGYLPLIFCSHEDISNLATEGETFFIRLPELCDRYPVLQERLFDNLLDMVDMRCL